MAMGMTYTEFWDGPSFLAVVYRDAFRIQRELENEQAWLQGLYVYDAFAVCLANMFSGRGAKKEKYFERPVDIFPLTEEEKKQREREEMEKMQVAMEEMVRRQKRKKKQKGE
jgi:hypothetical protein